MSQLLERPAPLAPSRPLSPVAPLVSTERAGLAELAGIRSRRQRIDVLLRVATAIRDEDVQRSLDVTLATR